jgi:arylsulfatase A-like enzyme
MSARIAVGHLNRASARAVARPRAHAQARSSSALWLGAGAGSAAGAALCLYQYFLPLTYIGLSQFWPLMLANLLVGLLVGLALMAMGQRAGRLGIVVALLMTAGGTGLWGAANMRRDVDVIVFVTDAVRADHLSAYGYNRDTTPALAALSKEPQGVLFRQAIAQGTYTWGGTPAILASIYPSMCDITLQGGLSEKVATLPQALSSCGYASFGISANPHISREKHFDRGFDSFEDCLAWSNVPRADALAAAFLKWQASAPGNRHFAFIFTTDAHGPYSPDVDALRRYRPAFDLPYTPAAAVVNSATGDRRLDLVALYDASIRFVDNTVGQMLATLRTRGRLDDTLFIFTADHGEAWWEHGEVGHGGAPYQEVTRVPLIMHFPSPVRFPRIQPRQKQPDWPVGQVDIMPTILDFVGSSRKVPAMRGRSLLPYLYGRAKPPAARGLLSESKPNGVWYRSWQRDGWHYMTSYRGQGGIDPRTERLFSLSQDAQERHDVSARNAKLRDRYRTELAAELRAAKPYVVSESAAKLSAEALRRLKSLGYVK